MEFLEALDQGAQHPFRFVARLAAVQPVLTGLSFLGHPLALLAIVLIAGTVFVRRGESGTAVRLALALAAASAFALLGQMLVHRPVPNPFYARWFQAPLTPNSFPSIEAIGAASVYGALGVLVARRRKKRWPILAGGFLVVLAGTGQLLVGHCYLTDVLTGWLAGAALAMLFAQLDADALARKGATP